MKFRKSILSASIATALLFAATAQAQNTSPQNNGTNGQPQSQTQTQTQTAATGAQTNSGDQSNPQQLQTVQVVGFRASLMKSLETQRAANAIVSAITAEDIGKFPNTNVAETMTLMPGVTIDRRFGQGGRVSVNGTDPNLNLSFLDGHPVASVDWLYGANPARGFDYAILAPDIVGQLEVYKTSEARLPSGSLGGTIIIHSRKPLDLPANTFTASIGGISNDQAKKARPNASVTYSWKNTSDTFGIDFAVSHYEEAIARQGREIFGYHPLSDYAGSPVVAKAIASGQAKGTDYVPDEVNAANFRQTRKRNSLLFNAQWKPTDQLSFLLGGLYVRENFDNFNQSMYGFQHSVPNNITAFTDSNGFVTSMDVCGVGQVDGNGNPCKSSGMTFDNNARAATTKVKGLHLDGDFKGDHWGVSGQVGVSTAHDRQQQWFLEPVYLGGYSQSLTGGWTFDNPSAARDPANWGTFNTATNTTDLSGPLGGFVGNTGIIPFNAKTTYGQVDFHVDFDSIFDRLQFGARYVNDKHNTNNMTWSGGVNQFTLSQLGEMQFPDIMQANAFAGISPDMKDHIAPTRSDIIDWINGSPNTFNIPIYAPFYIQNTYKITQKTEEAYVQQDFDVGNGLRGNFGVRFARNIFTSSSFVPTAGASLFVDAPNNIPAGWWQTQTHSFNNVLPSFNVIYDMGNNVVVRGSAAKVIAWAPYNQSVGTLFLNTTVLTGSGGNPNLDPYKAYVYQGSVEWYFAPQSVVAVNAFYYHILNYLSTIVSTESEFNGISKTNPILFAQYVASGQCNTDSFCNFAVTTPGSIGPGAIKGFSVSYQQPFGATGFGLLANYTFADGTTQIGQALPFNSKNSITLSPYFEKDGFLARVDYNWRSKYTAGGYVAGAPPATVSNYTELDASLGYTFNKHWSVNVSALNLLNEAYNMTEPLAPGVIVPVNKYTNGRRYMATVHFKL
ncbi:MAG: TonB-dependent receptor [Rhodanobacteraceae bacterium]